MSFFNRGHFFSGAVSDELKAVMEEYLQDREGARKGPWRPPVDLVEVEGGFVAQFELAGIQPEDLTITLFGNQLQVSGVRRECCLRQKRQYRQMEIHHGCFERAISLPEPVRTAEVTAHFANGLLEIYLPRAARRAAHIARFEIHII